ncbi:N-acetylmuramoyl-L-alanine amidase [Siminovitchia fortis]|uniref:N-acetylmuramoyl-L-alanine amidase n=1 Tax=Siminovitchia fortis TaxID=254758 RepID=A0A443J442_9BACI|nr:N-acetylmuramoyl-L-alanine amidase [Siminovitchia fortis]RWR15219.1 N-acetylmuramoyl-L-alanine amidase [Siminovitchia fortis]WHY82639.1 N-acetylmuramoyl-L-alanine amidase [Siminovitchia fortis]
MGKKDLLMILALIFIIAGCGKDSSSIAEDTETATITGEVVNVREKPGTSYPIITQIKKEETYPVINEKDDWYEIKLPSGETGWIAGWLASKDTAKLPSTEGSIAVQNLNVRSEPGIESDILGKLKEGDKVKIIEESNGWSKIHFESGTAWVSSEYVDKKDAGGKKAKHEPANIMVLHDHSNIRKKPDIKSNIVGQAYAGEVYEVIDQKNGWMEVKTSKGKKGYIAGWVVSSTDRPPSQRRPGKGVSGKLIVIDAGHGGNDQGAAGKNGTLEKYLTMKTAKLLEKKLDKAGAQVVLTRTGDKYVPLYNRTNIASENRADAFISLHFDSIDDASASGHTTYYYHSYEKRLADTIHSHLSESIKLKDRGTQFGDYYVMRENTQPAVLLELGYVSNEDEEKIIKTKKYREQVTDSIVKGLQDFFK